MLLVPVVSSGDDEQTGAQVAAAEALLPAEAVAEIEAGLQALGATGGTEQTHRLVLSSLPVASVLTVGLGKARPEWPADLIRRAAGVAASAVQYLGVTHDTAIFTGVLPAARRWHSDVVATLARLHDVSGAAPRSGS